MISIAINADCNKTQSQEGIKENTKTESDNYRTNCHKVDENYITDNGAARKKKLKTYPQLLTDVIDKITDENV